MAELVFNGHPLSEIAGLSRQQIRWLYYRDRDEHGRLVRARQGEGLDDGYEVKVKGMGVGFGEGLYKNLYRGISERWKGKAVKGKVFQGWTEQDLEDRWQAYLVKNPSLRKRDGKKYQSKFKHDKRMEGKFKP